MTARVRRESERRMKKSLLSSLEENNFTDIFITKETQLGYSRLTSRGKVHVHILETVSTGIYKVSFLLLSQIKNL